MQFWTHLPCVREAYAKRNFLIFRMPGRRQCSLLRLRPTILLLHRSVRLWLHRHFTESCLCIITAFSAIYRHGLTLCVCVCVFIWPVFPMKWIHGIKANQFQQKKEKKSAFIEWLKANSYTRWHRSTSTSTDNKIILWRQRTERCQRASAAAGTGGRRAEIQFYWN